MGFPDRIERTLELAHPPGTVWAAFAFSWQIYGLPEVDSRRTYVEFTLEPVTSGTRLRVVESGFAQLPNEAYHELYDDHAQGWTRELGQLVDYLNVG